MTLSFDRYDLGEMLTWLRPLVVSDVDGFMHVTPYHYSIVGQEARGPWVGPRPGFFGMKEARPGTKLIRSGTSLVLCLGRPLGTWADPTRHNFSAK